MPRRKSNEIKISDLPIPLQVLVYGFIAGILFGISIDAGVGVDEGSIALLILKTFCSSFNEIDTTEDKISTKTCWSTVGILFIIGIAVTILSILKQVVRIKPWQLGAGIYALGWVGGLLLIILN